jgi:hypothetical protein
VRSQLPLKSRRTDLFTPLLTAIFAAACVAFKVFNESLEEAGIENVPGFLIAADDIIIASLALASLAGAVVTNDKWISMKTALTLGPEEKEDMDQNEWEILRLPNKTRLADDSTRALIALATVVIALLPVPFLVEGLTSFSALAENEVLTSICVVISATAGAQAAVTLLLAEKEFSDAERRIAIQVKQAALSELFYAQAMAEAAVIPAGTAMAGAAYAGMNVAVEFSILTAVNTIFPAVFSSFRSTLSSVMSRVEANASWLELQVSRKGRVGRRKTDAVSSLNREIKLASEDFRMAFVGGGFSNDVRASLKALQVGGVREFGGLGKDRRRKVHLIAAELGMVSQSMGNADKRLVNVTNLGMAVPDAEEEQQEDNIQAQFEEIWEGVREEAKATIRQGVPKDVEKIAPIAAGLTALSVTSPVTAGIQGAELVIPLVTGGVSLAAVMQEAVGKEAVALAKQKAANMMRYQAESEAYIGRTMMAYAALPTDFAIATFSMTLSLFASEAAKFPHLSGITWAASPVALAISIAVRMLSVRRLDRLETCVQNVVSSVQAADKLKKLSSGQLHQGRKWLVPVGIAFMIPCSIPFRVTIACAFLMAEVGMIMATSATRLASAEYFAHRAGRNFARAEAWTQRAQNSVRFLPIESAAAIVSTLLATALATFSLPASMFFGAASLPIWLRAVQFSTQARSDATSASTETEDWQKLPGTTNLPWKYESRQYGEANQPADPAIMLAQTTMDAGIPEVVAVEGAAARLAKSQKKSLFTAIGRSAKSFVRIWDDRGPEELYSESPAELAVASVQSDLDEIRVSVRTTERTWFRTLGAVSFCAAAALFSPILLSELATEVILPVAGAGLVIFAVQAESEARRSISLSKVWAAELSTVVHTMEELLSTACIFRARLMSGTAITAAVGVCALASHHPWGGHHGGPPAVALAQSIFRIGLVIFNIGAAAWCLKPLRGCWRWTDHVMSINQRLLREQKTSVIAPKPGAVFDEEDPNTKAAYDAWQDDFEGKALKRRWTFRIMFLCVAALPALLLAIFPRAAHFSHRAVASTAAGAAVVATSLWLAERSLMNAERTVAARLRTYALTDAFSNEAEQQGALLPVASAAAIAIAGIITFGTELNPTAASVLAVFQAATWALASRRGVKTKFESDAALQVAAVTESGPRATYGMPKQRSVGWMKNLKKWILRA